MRAQRSLLGAGVAAAAGVAVLIGLGLWQVQRLEWKTALLGRIAANMAAASVEFPMDADAFSLPGLEEYRRVCAEGVFRHDDELYLFAPDRLGHPGFHIIAPLAREGGTAVLVNRGFVPPAKKDPATRAEGQVEGMVRVCGILRLDEEKRLFAPENDPEANLWYVRDAPAMAGALSLETKHPAFIDADETPNEGGLPVGGQTRLDIPNHHLGYAITWFGLALALLGVFAAFAWQRRRNASK
ncbi:MAG TPA: SURF1 family protein [Sphingomonadales bacterium]|nr:SURF1 family protein [Sphingomonadales bacterium]